MTMDKEEHYRTVAIGAGIIAILVGLATLRLPRWLRITLVLGLVVLAVCAGLIAYRYISTPKTLTVVAGSLDGDAPRLLSAIATQMASANAPVRLKVVDKGTVQDAAKAFSAGEADLAIVRADATGVPDARTVVQLTNLVVLLVALPGTSAEAVADLKGKTVGVIGADANQHVVQAISRAY